MIELRWRRANNEDKHPASGTPVFSDLAIHGKTRFLGLQYRTMFKTTRRIIDGHMVAIVNDNLGGGQWSEWKDVPVEDAE